MCVGRYQNLWNMFKFCWIGGWYQQQICVVFCQFGCVLGKFDIVIDQQVCVVIGKLEYWWWCSVWLEDVVFGFVKLDFVVMCQQIVVGVEVVGCIEDGIVLLFGLVKCQFVFCFVC